MASKKHKAISSQVESNSSDDFVLLGLAFLGLVLVFRYSSYLLSKFIGRWISKAWHLWAAIALLCVCWRWVFGLPFVEKSYLAFDALAYVSQSFKKSLPRHHVLTGFGEVVSWVQVYLWCILARAFWRIRFRSVSGIVPRRMLSRSGYILLSDDNEFEHRHIAKLVLGRNLRANEVVHHINGGKADNRLENLCLMHRQKHDDFHVWLKSRKWKTGRWHSARELSKK